jgi:hypothetical protein
MELYSPPYLDAGTRPRIADSPPRISYGEWFKNHSPDGVQVGRVPIHIEVDWPVP